MKRIACILLVLLLCVGLCACAPSSGTTSSDQSWTNVAEKKQLTVGVYVDCYPLCYLEKETYTGYEVEVLREIAARLGVSISFCNILQSGQTAAELLNAGLIDCAIGGIEYESELERSHALTAPYLQERYVLVLKKEDSCNNLADLSGKVLSAASNSPAHEGLKQSPLLFSAFARVEPVASDKDAVQAVLNGTADVAIVNETVAAHFVRKGEKLRALLNDEDELEQFGESEYVMAFALGANTLKKKVEDAYATMVRDKVTDDLSDLWFADLRKASVTRVPSDSANTLPEYDAETGLPLTSQTE